MEFSRFSERNWKKKYRTLRIGYSRTIYFSLNRYSKVIIPIREYITCKSTSSYKPYKLNLDYRINIQGSAQEEWERDLQKCDLRRPGGRLIVKLLNPPYSLDVDPVVQIEVCTICMKMLVCT